jgi:hypothetical protein
MISNINHIFQILNTLFKWIYSLIKHYRVILGVILFINLVSPSTYIGDRFPWITFFIFLYFVYFFYKKYKRRTSEKIILQKPSLPSIHIDNKQFIHIEGTTVRVTNRKK